MVSRAESRRIRGLAHRKQREAERLFLAEGIRVVEELLASPIVPRLALVSSSLEDTPRGRALESALRDRVELRSVRVAELNELSRTRTNQGVVVVAEIPEARLEAARSAGPSAVLVLDGVQDPGNLGTLVRTAAAFGFDAVAALPGTVDAWNPKSVRASAGGVFRLPVVPAEVSELMTWLDAGGYAVVGADAAGRPLSDPIPERVALAVGNEGSGLGSRVRERCDDLVAVPMRGGAESLNVAIAAGILMHELTRERP
jgi:TrmH family RNA methyltransferase